MVKDHELHPPKISSVFSRTENNKKLRGVAVSVEEHNIHRPV
ncbi:14410_t:CDS:2 [Gigaspora margarita]|uniref:14410_t:CDS:1 n=1 Tax=Gigaspora margarita TaxID=4874 RepID=A0ABM8W5T5_GIGMA|nr:14410_t:CDS:2 [Gigaspora margarita]